MILKIDGNPIHTVDKKPIRFFGKWFTIDGKNTTMIHAWLREVDKSGLPGTDTALRYQYEIFPLPLIWPISIYDVPSTTIERLKEKVRKLSC